jgi:DNA-binding NarL/FixJ family response regulator
MINKILVVDDHKVVRYMINQYLNKVKVCNSIYVASNLGEAKEIILSENPEIILLDINLGDENGIDLVRSVQFGHQTGRFIILSMLTDECLVKEAFRLGASGYVSKYASFFELQFAVETVSRGNKYISTDIKMNAIPV